MSGRSHKVFRGIAVLAVVFALLYLLWQNYSLEMRLATKNAETIVRELSEKAVYEGLNKSETIELFIEWKFEVSQSDRDEIYVTRAVSGSRVFNPLNIRTGATIKFEKGVATRFRTWTIGNAL